MQIAQIRLNRTFVYFFFWNDKIFIVELSLFYDHTQLYLSAIMDKKHSNERI